MTEIVSPPPGAPQAEPSSAPTPEQFARAVGHVKGWPSSYGMRGHDARVVEILLAGIAALSAPKAERLRCPECHELHVDVGRFATHGHHTHSCQACGATWRPAVHHTVGVRFLPGFKDDPAPSVEESCKAPAAPHVAACAGCFFAGQHIDELHALICESAPLGWAASTDMAGAGAWEKRADQLISKWWGGRGPKQDEQPESCHPGKIADLVPKFADGVLYYLRELLNGDQPWHVIGHIESLCKDFDTEVKAEVERLRAPEAAAKAVVT